MSLNSEYETQREEVERTYSLANLNSNSTSPSRHEHVSLEYDLRQHKWKIILFAIMVLLDSMILPVGLFFVLWYGTDLSHSTVFNIITAVVCGTGGWQYFRRIYRLCHKRSTCRVLGGQWWTLDWFHWLLTLSFALVIIELCIGTVPTPPWVRICAMPVPTFCFVFGVQALVIEYMSRWNYRAPFRVSSTPAGSPLRAGVYYLVEDVVAVDGAAGTAFRLRMGRRYESSPVFRKMLHHLTLLWSIPAIFVGAGTLCFVFLARRDIAYVIGWCLPWIWGAIWIVLGRLVVKRYDAEEREQRAANSCDE